MKRKKRRKKKVKWPNVCERKLWIYSQLLQHLITNAMSSIVRPVISRASWLKARSTEARRCIVPSTIAFSHHAIVLCSVSSTRQACKSLRRWSRQTCAVGSVSVRWATRLEMSRTQESWACNIGRMERSSGSAWAVTQGTAPRKNPMTNGSNFFALSKRTRSSVRCVRK